MPIINKESYTDLRNLTDSVSQCTQSLTKLGQPVGNWGTLLIIIILPKIDKGSRREWELKRTSIEEFPTLTEFLEFLTNRSAFLESEFGDCTEAENTGKRCSKLLDIKPETINTTVLGISSSSINAAQQITTTIKSRTSTFQGKLPFMIIRKITESLPTVELDKENLQIPYDVQLADPQYHIPAEIDILLGASIFWELLRSRQIRPPGQTLILQETLLGWIIAGQTQSNETSLMYRTHCGVSANLKLSNQLEKFWKMEEITYESQCSKEENKCEAHFVSTFNRNHEGRFIVELPIKGDKQHFMREYLNLNHMQEVSFDERDYKPSYYIPHHSVIKEDSITTKVRVVFDASCKTSAGKSLNDMLMVGPTL
ncbi:uncharacterized protein [Polyergus mexicanus]|uniref:uncharacterized protein n=1 Tax=Polyergus mexicanus TaxID=615972 RepID=UPI0038B607D1